MSPRSPPCARLPASTDSRVGQCAHLGPAREPVGDHPRRGFVGQQDVADPARLSTTVQVAIPLVVVARCVSGHGDGRRHVLDESGDGRSRQGGHWRVMGVGRRSDEPRRASLLDEDVLGDELLDDPPAQTDGPGPALGRDVPSARSATHLGHPLLHARDRDRMAADDGDVWHRVRVRGRFLPVAASAVSRALAHRHHQPLTPPTVMPSTKNRCAKQEDEHDREHDQGRGAP